MKFKLYIISFAFSLLNFYNANAADPIIYHSPEAPIYDAGFHWSGMYLGGTIGYGWGRASLQDSSDYGTLKSDGFLAGGYAGYNFSFSDYYMLGIEGDINYSDFKKGRHFSNYNANWNWKTRTKWEAALRARVGITYERFMPYIAGGIAFAGVQNDLKEVFISNPTQTSRYHKNSKFFTGWTLGTGAEYAVADHWLMRLEYRYNDFGNQSFGYNDAQEKFKSQDVRLGVSYKF